MKNNKNDISSPTEANIGNISKSNSITNSNNNYNNFDSKKSGNNFDGTMKNFYCNNTSHRGDIYSNQAYNLNKTNFMDSIQKKSDTFKVKKQTHSILSSDKYEKNRYKSNKILNDENLENKEMIKIENNELNMPNLNITNREKINSFIKNNSKKDLIYSSKSNEKDKKSAFDSESKKIINNNDKINQYKNNNYYGEFEICKLHNKHYEALCITCKELICSTCAMFKNKHVNHNYVNLEEGSKFIRKEISKNIDKKYFEKDYTEIPLLKLKEIRLNLEKTRHELKSQMEDVFEYIIFELNKRKRVLEDEINQLIDIEVFNIREREIVWEKREKIAKEILKLNSSRDDSQLLLHSGEILNGLDSLSEGSLTLNVHTFYDLEYPLRLEVNTSKNKLCFYEDPKNNKFDVYENDKDKEKESIKANEIINSNNSFQSKNVKNDIIRKNNYSQGYLSKEAKSLYDQVESSIKSLKYFAIETTYEDICQMFDKFISISRGMPLEIVC